jgi:NADPH2:quinone reductase
MDAVRIHEYGDASRLVLEDIPIPEPKAGELRIKIEATGLNYIDTYQRKGLYPIPLPLTLGAEFAGWVDAVGEGVTEFRIGDRVATANGSGGYAEYGLAPASRTVSTPANVSNRQAAAVILQGMTAHYLVFSTFPLKSGETALIHAAAGGAGQLLVQVAKMQGARVIATVSTEEKAAIARESGADEVILYAAQDFEVEVKRLTKGRGVDVVYDGVGQATFAKGLNCLKPRGMMVLYGQASGPVEPLNPQLLNQKGSLFLTRPTLAHYLLSNEEFLWRAGDIFKWLESGELNVRIDRTFPLRDASAAHEYIQARLTKGKVLLIP